MHCVEVIRKSNENLDRAKKKRKRLMRSIIERKKE